MGLLSFSPSLDHSSWRKSDTMLWIHLGSLFKHCRKVIAGLPCTISNSNTQGKTTREATASSRLLNETSRKTYSEPSNSAATKFMALKLGETTNIPHFMTLSQGRFIIKQYAYNYSSFVSGTDIEFIDLFIENDLTIQCACAIEEEMLSSHLVKLCFKDSVRFVFLGPV